MLLRLEEQNNLFDLFQKIYDELIRVDKEDDWYDGKGMKTVNGKYETAWVALF